MTMRIGVQLPEVERPVRWAEMREIALVAEDTGFDSLWVGDHLLYRNDGRTTGPWEAWSMLAALGEATSRIDIGPLVAATSFHAPAMLAKKAATVDEISGGRLILGLGAGWNETEFNAYGFPFDRRASRFEEAFHIIRTLLTEGSIDFDGKFYTLRDCELVPRARKGIPIMIGSHGPRVLRMTLPYVDRWNGWYSWFGNTTEGLAAMFEGVDSACADIGRDPGSFERSVSLLIEAPGAVGNVERASRWRDPAAISGDTEEIAAQLREFEDLGLAEVQLVVDPITVDSVEWLSGIFEYLGR